MAFEQKNIEDLKANPKNPRTMQKHDAESLRTGMKEFGDLAPIVFNVQTGQLVGGHQRINVLTKMMSGQKQVVITQRFETPDQVGTVALGYVIYENRQFAYREVSWPREKEIAANIAANRVQGDFQLDMLAELTTELHGLENSAELLALTGQTTDEINRLLNMSGANGEEGDRSGNLANKFIVPPFSILDTKQGYWLERKRAWMDMGIKSELGRDGSLAYGSEDSTDPVSIKLADAGGTSVFDPVLCELAYRWFNVDGGLVLDPFAGGSVRGIVASKTGFQYVGHELRTEQVEENRNQASQICNDPIPVWVAGDSNITLDASDISADLIFSCPPYADLEVYSDNPNDLSNMPYSKFLEFYQSIITKSCAKLKNDRFAVWVIGEVRGKDGAYYNFVGDTITAFKNAGLSYYNEMILATSISTLALRAARQFNASRKTGKCHQNVLVFYKGDLKNIKQNFGALDFSELEKMLTEEKDLQL